MHVYEVVHRASQALREDRLMPLLVSLRGRAGAATIGSAPETWSCGLWYRGVTNPAAAPNVDEATAIADLAYDRLKTFISSSQMSFQANVFASEVRVYGYDQANLQESISIGYSEEDGGSAGTATPQHPLECSVVLSLYTEGRAKPRYGRIYLPTMGFDSNADGRLDTTSQNAILVGSKAFLTGLDSDVGTGLGTDVELVVQSRTLTGSVYPYKPVRELRVGRVVDTQRRRRRQLDEAYQDTTYP